ncbi:hypothetical protein ACG7TL_008088 [Trametes sanguinea]
MQTRLGATFSPWAAESLRLLRVPVPPDASELLMAAVSLAEGAMGQAAAEDVQDGLLKGHDPLNGTKPMSPPFPEPNGAPPTLVGASHGLPIQVASSPLQTGRAPVPASSKGSRDKARFKARRRARRIQEAARAAEATGTPQAAKGVSLRRSKAAIAVGSEFSLGGIGPGGPGPAKPTVVSTAYVGRRYEPAVSNRSTVTKADLLSQGFCYVQWKLVIGALVGAPRDETWPRVMTDLCATFDAARSALPIRDAATEHHRGRFAAAYRTAVGKRAIKRSPPLCWRIPPFSEWPGSVAPGMSSERRTAALKVYAPRLHRYYSDTMDALLHHHRGLRRNFVNSVFASATFNVGPQTVARTHTDHLNLPAGLCAITALGSFDAEAGGHLILWDLKLVIKFPPGATVLIPSALLCHSNTALQPGETRFSLTQYSAGGLFQWVECGFKPQGAVSAAGKKRYARGEEHWNEGLARFSRASELTTAAHADWTPRCGCAATKSLALSHVRPSPPNVEDSRFRAPPSPPPLLPQQPLRYVTESRGCLRVLRNKAGLTQHLRRTHPDWDPDEPALLSMSDNGAGDNGAHYDGGDGSDDCDGIGGGNSVGQGTNDDGDDCAINSSGLHRGTDDNRSDDEAGDDDKLPGTAEFRDDEFDIDDSGPNPPQEPPLSPPPSSNDEVDSDSESDDLSISSTESLCRDFPQNVIFDHPSWTFDDLAEEECVMGREPTPELGLEAHRWDSSPTQSTTADPDEASNRTPSPSMGSSSADARRTIRVHPVINGSPCNAEGITLPPNSPPPPTPAARADDWSPYADRAAFELADLLYRKEQMSAGNIDALLQIWAATLVPHGAPPPFASQADMYNTIDRTALGDVQWESFTLSHSNDAGHGDADVLPWMNTEYSEIICYGDGHYRRVIYGLGPYIADYPGAGSTRMHRSGMVPGVSPIQIHMDVN